MCAPDGTSPGRRGNPAHPGASPPVDGEELAAQAPPTARAQSPPSAAPWPASWASATDDDEDDEDDEEELAPQTPPVTSATVLAAAVLAARKADPAAAGRLARPRRRHRAVTAAAPSTGPRPPDGLLCDPAVLVEGLGSLSLPPVASGDPISADVPLPAGDVLPAPSLLWVASLSSNEDDDVEELAPQTPLASTKGVVSGSVRGTADVRHVEKAPAEPCGSLSAADEALRDKEGWVQVGRGGRPGREPSSLLPKEGLERSLAFKRWARGRCFRCLERGHQVSTCREPFRCIRCRRPGHRERFCRARFPAARSRSPDTRARSSDAHAPCQRSRSPSAQPRRPSASRSWAEVVCRSSLPTTLMPRPSPRCCEEFDVNASLDSRFQCQFDLLRLELAQLVADLREEVASLKLLLARVGDSLEPTEACASGGQELAPV